MSAELMRPEPRKGNKLKQALNRRARHSDGTAELPPVLRCLFEEHRHLAALVGAIENKFRQGSRLETSDYYLLRDIVAYMHDYPDHVHHPTEDALFEKLLRRKPSMTGAVKRLRREHAAVGAETQRLLGLLDELIGKSTPARERAIGPACTAYARHQREHMRLENQDLFPAAMNALTASDWQDIESYFAVAEDPLFGKLVGSRHRLLYEYLLDPASKNSATFIVSRLFSMERFLLLAEVLEKGMESGYARLRDLGDAVSGETREAVLTSLKPGSFGTVAALPFKYTLSLGKAVFDCSNDLIRIYSLAARDTLALFGSLDPGKQKALEPLPETSAPKR